MRPAEKNRRSLKHVLASAELKLALLMTASILLLMVPYFNQLDIFIRYWDGPNYLYVAKTLYQIPENHPFVAYGTTAKYFACHLPLYPLFIRACAWLVGYPYSLLVATWLTAVFAVIAFYRLLLSQQWVKNPFATAALFVFLPPRWLIYHTVGATEPLFLGLTFMSMQYFEENKLGRSMILASLAATTRIVGCLLVPIYFMALIRRNKWRLTPYLALIMIGPLLTFSFYQYQFHDFFAYFSWNQKLIHATPFEIIISYAKGGVAHSSELYLLWFIVLGLGVWRLRGNQVLFFYGVVHWLFCAFIFHVDLSRYLLSLTPFALLIAYDEILASAQARWAVLTLSIPLSYLYAWNLLPTNVLVPEIYAKLLQVL